MNTNEISDSGDYAVMALDPHSGEEVTVARFETVGDADEFVRSMRTEYVGR